MVGDPIREVEMECPCPGSGRAASPITSPGQIKLHNEMWWGEEEAEVEEIKGLATQGAAFFLHFGSPGRRRAM